MKRSLIISLIALLCGLLMAACALQASAAPSPPPTRTPYASPSPTLTPPGAKETVAEFYGWYTSYPGSVMADEAYRDNEILRPYLSDTFVENIDALHQSFGGRDGYDPFLCSHDIPVHLEYAVVKEDEQTAQVRVSRYTNGSIQPRDMLVDLVRDGDRWQIDDTHCAIDTEDGMSAAALLATQPNPLASPTPINQWQTYRNEPYGFHVDYPAAWTPVESFDRRLSESDPVAGYVTFIQGAEGAVTPVALVVITGPEEVFRLLFPKPEDGHRVLYVGGRIVTIEEHFDRETYYFIHHPQDQTLRVAVRVIAQTPSFDRDVESIVGRMLESFDFDG